MGYLTEHWAAGGNPLALQRKHMSTKHAPSWYATKTNKGSPHEQGLIIEETTGRNVAVAYQAEDAPLIAAAPELLAACELIIGVPGVPSIAPGTCDIIRAAIAKAKGSA